jgi:hypothetical protein
MAIRTDVLRVDFADERCVLVVCEGERPWTLRIDATAGHPALSPRGVLRQVGGLLLLLTEGEHRRSGAAYFPQLHRLSRDGLLLWSLRARVVGEPLLVGEHLLVPVRMARSMHEPEERAELYVQVRDPDTGMLLAMYPLRPPPVLERAYVHAVRGVGVRLHAQGDAVEVTVSAWFTGRQSPPRGAGEFAVRIALSGA